MRKKSGEAEWNSTRLNIPVSSSPTIISLTCLRFPFSPPPPLFENNWETWESLWHLLGGAKWPIFTVIFVCVAFYAMSRCVKGFRTVSRIIDFYTAFGLKLKARRKRNELRLRNDRYIWNSVGKNLVCLFVRDIGYQVYSGDLVSWKRGRRRERNMSRLRVSLDFAFAVRYF